MFNEHFPTQSFNFADKLGLIDSMLHWNGVPTVFQKKNIYIPLQQKNTVHIYPFSFWTMKAPSVRTPLSCN